ncbi:ribonuclease H-like domain-containing protein [Tanacetum coccineum]|uniref:Ribonuclease H-like domain-containing protein n=1 Tax=Tanacetum coccineum TaxID=301880 RepID=A0ABQ5IBV2_9ASTR
MTSPPHHHHVQHSYIKAPPSPPLVKDHSGKSLPKIRIEAKNKEKEETLEVIEQPMARSRQRLKDAKLLSFILYVLSEIIMDPNLSLGKIFLGDNVIEISSDKIEGSGDWNSLEYQDTAGSKGKKVMNALSFYRMETDEISERYIAPCFVNGLEAYDGEVNLEFDENLISNEFTGELYFVKFIINPEEDDFEPGVILGRSFLRLDKGVVDFGNGVFIIYPKPNPFEEDSEKTGKSSNDWDQLLDFNFDDVPKFGEELPLFVCKMGKNNHNKKQATENLNFFYQDIGTSSSAGGHSTEEDAAKDAIAIRMSQNFALLEEERPIIETMAYNDKYTKILDEVWKDNVELDGMIVKKEEEAVNENALADTGSDINTMPYQIYEQLGREDMKKVDRGITMINHTPTEAMGILTNVLCQVGVTTLIAKFLILDILIDRYSLIVVGRGFLRTIGGIVNAPKRLFSTFDGFCHQTFRAARSDFMRNAESDSDDEEACQIKRNKFEAPIYRPKHAPYLNCNDPDERSLALQTTSGTHDNEAESSRNKRSRQHKTVEENILNRMGCDGEIYDMLRIKVREAELEFCLEIYSTYEFDEVCDSDELQTKKIIKFRLGGRAHSLTLLELARRLGLYQAKTDLMFTLKEESCFYYQISNLEGDAQDDHLWLGQRTSEYDKIQKNDLWLLSMFNARHQNRYENVAWLIARWMKRKGADDMIKSLSALIYYRDLGTTTLRELIDSEGRLIPKDPQPGVPRVGIPRPSRASMQDLYDRMGRMEIRQEAIERMEYRKSYHWDRYQGVSEHMVGVYSVPLQGAYNPPGYAQP